MDNFFAIEETTRGNTDIVLQKNVENTADWVCEQRPRFKQNEKKTELILKTGKKDYWIF